MRSHRTTWSLVLGLVGLAACAPSGDSGVAVMTDADRAAIEERLYQMEYDWVAANESGDASVLDRLFAEDFIYTIDDGTLYLKEAFIALAGEDAGSVDSNRIEDMETRWYANTAVVTGVGVDYWTDEDGTDQRAAFQFTNVFVERDGNWQVVVGHSSSKQ